MNKFLRSYNNYDADAVSRETSISFEDVESMTRQEFREECDINTIVRQFGLTGKMPEFPHPAEYGDFSDVHDYQSALNALIAADSAFMEFPAEVRGRFEHNPQKLMEFLAVKENRAEAQKLGLIPMDPERTRDVVQAVDELAAKLTPAK